MATSSQLLPNGNLSRNGKTKIDGEEVEAVLGARAAGADAGVALTGLTGHSSTSGTFMKLKTYLLALRPWSLSASLVPTLLGSALAYRSQWAEEFSLATFFLTAFTVVTVHCAGNVVNTYFDFIKGIDKQKADDRTLVDHILTKDEVSTRTDGSIKPIVCSFVHRMYLTAGRPTHFFRWYRWAPFCTWLVAEVLFCWLCSVRRKWSTWH
ncbi:ubiA prenyltransferase domain-containing protein 1 homolog isoform X2 [Drosophila teissieri]|uniref:ubiA prenyltransferase domain-containing protein 1 homolog isoform X2 n=1 Tax=Drosophila teissieri TaxID=7243 RepID=UPI001CB9F4F9|nr:ubiA prenyltransferase domain-containing protein 1 homolog isoform X2 [Drosophila teissieri]